MERLDIAHNLFTAAFSTLHLAPIREPITKESDTRILDVGTGTGIWAIEMAELVSLFSWNWYICADKRLHSQYPDAEVILPL